MSRSIVVIVAVLFAVGVTGGATAYFVRKHETEVAAANAERARLAAAQQAARQAAEATYRRLSDIQARANAALDQLSEVQTSYDRKYNEAARAGQKRHDLAASQPYDFADGLTFITTEKTGVDALQPMTAEKAEAARSAANAFTEVYGDGATSALINDISVAAEAEGAGLSDWWHAARSLEDYFIAHANGRYYVVGDDIAGLYKSSDDEAARARERWGTVASRLATLRNRLDKDVSHAASLVAPSTSRLDFSTPAPLQIPRDVSSSAHAQADLRSAPRTTVSSDSPLTSDNALPILRATSALSVSTKSTGGTAYVTVPDTPARGTANSKQIWTGKMADGRWVGIIPLDSGGASEIGYALIWVWADGRARFVGELPAENNGYGHLNMAVQNGEIHVTWPAYASSDQTCCPSMLRTKVLTLDGIRLRVLDDQITVNR